MGAACESFFEALGFPRNHCQRGVGGSDSRSGSALLPRVATECRGKRTSRVPGPEGGVGGGGLRNLRVSQESACPGQDQGQWWVSGGWGHKCPARSKSAGKIRTQLGCEGRRAEMIKVKTGVVGPWFIFFRGTTVHCSWTVADCPPVMPPFKKNRSIRDQVPVSR